MEHPCFAFDFCRFPMKMAFDRPLGCVTDLIWCEELSALLRFYGVPECEIGKAASQYQRFRAFCGVVPHLTGHRLPGFISRLLKDIFEIDQPICEDTCDEIWRITSQKMIENDLTWALFFKRYRISSKIGLLCGATEGEAALTVGGTPVLDANTPMRRIGQPGRRSLFLRVIAWKM